MVGFLLLDDVAFAVDSAVLVLPWDCVDVVVATGSALTTVLIVLNL